MSPLRERATSAPRNEPRTRSHRKRQRAIVFVWLLVLITTFYFTFSSIAGPRGPGSTTARFKDAVLTASSSHHKHKMLLQDLSAKYVPKTGKHGNNGRLVVVGDVHGMKDALVELLAKIDFDDKHDHLVLAGDMVSKGPDSKGVVDLVRKLHATGVRGNHEDRILMAHAEMLAEGVEVTEEGIDDLEAESEVESSNHKNAKDRALIRHLGEKRIKWLKECPVILRVGEIGTMGQVVVVHAGLEPGVKLEKQDPVMVMNMRTTGDDGKPSDEREGRSWIKAWNKYQKDLPKHERTTVIYGHDSKRGLQKEKYSFGIDTGCLKGGKLTALIIEGGHSKHSHKLVHVNCKDGRQ